MTDAQILLRLAKLSAATYKIADADVRAEVAALGYTYACRIGNPDIVAVICTEEGGNYREGIVAYQGTRFAENTDLSEIWDDLDNGRVDLGDGAVAHSGFWRPLAQQWPDVLAALHAVGVNGPITFTGHSLGGVRANLALRLAQDAKLTADAVSFGAPKGANQWFWEGIAPTAPVRVVNRHDFAPLWPLCTPDLVQPGPMTWINQSNRIEQVIGWQGLFPSVFQHDIDAYISALEANLGVSVETV